LTGFEASLLLRPWTLCLSALLRLLIDRQQAISLVAVQALLGAGSTAPAITVPPADLGAL
jgi:hypothetical protein